MFIYDFITLVLHQQNIIIKIIKMSIYSGFATRQQQHAYDTLIQDLIHVMQKRIIKFYKNEETNEQKFYSILVYINNQLAKMEEAKYLQPKLSKTFHELIHTCNIVQATKPVTKNKPNQSKTQNFLLSQQTNRNNRKQNADISLNFSSDKIAQDLKSGWLIGKIKHQNNLNISREQPTVVINGGLPDSKSQSKEDEIDYDFKINDKQQKKQVRALSTNGVKNKFYRPDFTQNNIRISNNLNPEKKNLQYVIREYVSKSHPRRRQMKVPIVLQ